MKTFVLRQAPQADGAAFQSARPVRLLAAVLVIAALLLMLGSMSAGPWPTAPSPAAAPADGFAAPTIVGA